VSIVREMIVCLIILEVEDEVYLSGGDVLLCSDSLVKMALQ
jgi:hypothetical protein